jgi:putative membrane protein
MQVTHLGKVGMVLSAVIFAAAACGGADNDADSLASDTGAVNSASGDLAGANIAATPAMVKGFLTTVNQGEIEAGQLATDKATNAQVKQYAQLMVTEHRRANTMMDSAGGTAATAGTAGAAGASAQGGQPAADAHAMHQQAMQTLQNTPKGKGFDSTYIALMVAGHQDVLTRLEGMRGTGGTAAGSTAPAGTPAAGTAGAAGSQPAGTGNPGAVGSTGTTQPAGAANQGDATQTQLTSSIDMVRRHLERAQEIQRTLQGGAR